MASEAFDYNPVDRAGKTEADGGRRRSVCRTPEEFLVACTGRLRLQLRTENGVSKYVVDSQRCTGCAVCARFCPVAAIEFSSGIARIVDEKCIDCGVCASKCPFGAIQERVSEPVWTSAEDPAAEAPQKVAEAADSVPGGAEADFVGRRWSPGSFPGRGRGWGRGWGRSRATGWWGRGGRGSANGAVRGFGRGRGRNGQFGRGW